MNQGHETVVIIYSGLSTLWEAGDVDNEHLRTNKNGDKTYRKLSNGDLVAYAITPVKEENRIKRRNDKPGLPPKMC